MWLMEYFLHLHMPNNNVVYDDKIYVLTANSYNKNMILQEDKTLNKTLKSSGVLSQQIVLIGYDICLY